MKLTFPSFLSLKLNGSYIIKHSLTFKILSIQDNINIGAQQNKKYLFP